MEDHKPTGRQRGPRRRTWIVVGGVLAAMVVAAVLVLSHKTVGPTLVDAGAASPMLAAPQPPPSPVPERTTIATVTGPIAYRAEPDGPAVGALPMGKWWQDTKDLPVIGRQGDQLHVRLPERPNGSTGWIDASEATLSTTTYAILIDVTDYRLQLYDKGHLIADVPAGVGTSNDPTPLGDFYVMDIDHRPPGPSWGPFILDTNAHSEAITSWEGSGDAFTAIHGPVGADGAIGTDGGAISHGCVRLHSADLARLDSVPAGAPVVVVA